MPDQKPFRLSRRGFLATSAAAGLSTTHATAKPAPAIATALIGCGHAGSQIAAAIRQGGTGLHLTVLSDMHTDRMQTLADEFGAQTEPDWARAITRKDVDAVVIATPDRWHAEMASAALDAGKHVYLLPPVGPTAEEARALYARTTENDRLLYVGMEAAPAALWSAAADQLRHRKGPPRWIQANCPPVTSETRPAWTRDRACSQGVAAHRLFSMLYPLQYHLGLGAPVRATALGGVFNGDSGETSDALTCTVRYDRGTTVVLTCAPGHVHQQPAILRGPWPHAELAWTADAFDVPRLDLHEFGRAIGRGCPSLQEQLQAACTVQTALSEALEAATHRPPVTGPAFGPEIHIVA